MRLRFYSAWRGALGLGLLASLGLAACNRSGQGETTGSQADTLTASQPTPVDTVKLKRQVMLRDSLRADSIARKTGQLPGAILPGHRIVAFYGNIRSKGMGILGREPKAQMMRKFDKVLAEWQAADPSLPVMPALHSVTITAQGAAGRRRQVPPDELQSDALRKTRAWAKEKNAHPVSWTCRWASATCSTSCPSWSSTSRTRPFTWASTPSSRWPPRACAPARKSAPMMPRT
ncbi:MAG: hypothetical protein WKG07_23650 [Hymenobacter sp.]